MAFPNIPSLLSLSAIITSLPIIYIIGLITYNLYIHPFSSFPGPKIAGATPLWWILHSFRGDLDFQILALHEKYGDVVRIAPHSLDFSDPAAWKEIYGHRQGGGENAKNPIESIDMNPMHPSILFAGRERHAFLRKLLSNAFSDKVMKSQEHILQYYIDGLIQRLRETCENGGQSQNMAKWYAFTTFDIIGRLSFNEDFDCLKDSNYHPWIAMIFSNLKLVAYVRAMKRIPYLVKILMKFVPKSTLEKSKASRQIIRSKVLRRKEKSPDYTDFMTHLLDAEKAGQLDLEDLCVNTQTLVVGGSETTATLLAGTTYYILRNKEVLKKLVREVRSSFSGQEEITTLSVGGLRYLLACLDEGLRLYPPAPTGHERIVSSPGLRICGHFIPAGLSVGISQYAAFRASTNWSQPLEFIPERWLEQRETVFANDKRDALQPFSFGARNCIGRNLAYIEMRLILAKLLWNFDVDLADDCAEDWLDQKIFTTWETRPLMVKLTPVVR